MTRPVGHRLVQNRALRERAEVSAETVAPLGRHTNAPPN
jgi:hypothetical protein